MKCLEPGCPLNGLARTTPSFCRKHVEARKRSVVQVRIILRVVNDELLLCFPDREVVEGRMRAWGAAGPKTISEYDYLFGVPPRNSPEQKSFEQLIARYQLAFNVVLHPMRSWTAKQKKACWGLTPSKGEKDENNL